MHTYSSYRKIKIQNLLYSSILLFVCVHFVASCIWLIDLNSIFFFSFFLFMCDVDDDRHMKQDEEKKIPVIPYYLLYIYGVCYFICEYKVKCKCIVLPKIKKKCESFRLLKVNDTMMNFFFRI